MPPVPDPAFRSLLAECSKAAFRDFVADLWRARGHEARLEDDRLVVDGRDLRPTLDVDGGAVPADGVVVAARELPAHADDSIVGPSELRRMLLYDVPRERAAELFEAHFGRPLNDEWIDRTPSASEPAPTGGSEFAASAEAEPESTDRSEPDSTGRATPDSTERTEPDATPDEAPTSSRQALAGRRLAGATARRTYGRVDARALIEDGRFQVAVVAALAVLTATGWGLFLYQPTPQTTAGPSFDYPSSPPVEGSYRADSQVHVTGNGTSTAFTKSRTYAPGDPAVGVRTIVWSRDSADDGLDLVQWTEYERGDVSYVRATWTNDTNDRWHADGEDTVRTDEATRSAYRVDRHSGGVESIPIRTTPVGHLRIFPYERRGTTTHEGQTAVRYVPTSGWTTSSGGPRSGSQTIRVRSASGEVLVDDETGALLSVDVEATVVLAETWAEALTRPTHVLSIHYRVESDVDRPDPPPWIEGLDANATAEYTAGESATAEAASG